MAYVLDCLSKESEEPTQVMELLLVAFSPLDLRYLSRSKWHTVLALYHTTLGSCMYFPAPMPTTVTSKPSIMLVIKHFTSSLYLFGKHGGCAARSCDDCLRFLLCHFSRDQNLTSAMDHIISYLNSEVSDK